jgi:hypothetical protein
MSRFLGLAMASAMGMAVASAAALLGCNSSSGGGGADAGPCNLSPRACKAGQTCWVSDDNGDYACFPSGAGRVGDPCKNYVAMPQCADGLDCVQTSQSAPGQCAQYCNPMDPTLGCPDGSQCTPLLIELEGGLVGTQEAYFCPPPAAPADGGTEMGPVDSGPGDAATNDATVPADSGGD